MADRSASSRERARGLIVALFVLLFLGALGGLGWLGWQSSRAARAAREEGATLARAPVSPGEGTPPDRASPGGEERGVERARPAGLRLRATLSGGRPLRGRALVGVATIDEEDRAAWLEWQAEGRPGAGPRRLEELARVREWQPAPLEALAEGGARLGPVEVPPAPRYRVLAWAPDGTFYWGDYFPPAAPPDGVLDAGTLAPHAPTGLALRLRHGAPELAPYLLGVERVADEETAARAADLGPAIMQMAPLLGKALRGETLLGLGDAEDGAQRLLPLPPDRALRLRLRSATGLEGEPVEVALREGEVVAVELDLRRVFPGAERGLLELDGQLVLGETGRPAAGARLDWEELPGAEPVVAGADGRFVLRGVPPWRTTRFVVTPPRTEGRPLGPERTTWEFKPEPGASGRVRVRWRLPLYHWLVVPLDAPLRRRLAARARAPYPTFLVERREAEGRWRARAADHFREEEGGLAVSIVEPGRYRVVAAVSPYEVYPSEEVEMGSGDLVRTARLTLAGEGRPCELRVRAADGRALVGVPVRAMGGRGSLPPLEAETDTAGRLDLGRVWSEELHLELARPDGTAEAVEAAEACRRSGVVEVVM